MNPLAIKAWVLAVAGVLALAIGGGIGWSVNGWRLNAEMASIKADRATDQAKQAQTALSDLADASKKIHDAAENAQTDLSGINTQLQHIREDFKNAKAAPLPIDCRPDAVRVRELSDASRTVDQAIAGQRTSTGLQAERQSGS